MTIPPHLKDRAGTVQYIGQVFAVH